MNSSSLIALLPYIILAAGSVLTMLVIAFKRSHRLIMGLTLVVFLLAFIAIPIASAQGVRQVTPLLATDGFAYLITGIIIVACFVVTLFAYGYFRIHPDQPEEFYLLLLTAALGSTILTASNHFISLFLGLEILSISLYAMIGYSLENPINVEAALKYLILAASSAAFMLFGMALVYAEVGKMDFPGVALSLTGGATQPASFILLTGLILILVGIGFKLALVPFHMWTPDVYEGAPAPVTAFVATVSKGSLFAVLLRFFLPMQPISTSMLVVFVIIAIATMLIGNLLALLQNNLKRLLAYSSIANLGYLMVAFLAGGSNGVTSAAFYLVSYFITILAAFGVVTVMSQSSQDAGSLDEYRGLMWRRPWLAAVLTAAMFSLAGIPLTVGFIGKFYLVLAGVGSALWLLVIVLVIASAIGLFYYLRVVTVLFADRPATAAPIQIPSYSLAGGIALAVLLVLMVGLGVFPSPLLNVIQSMVAR